MSTSQGDSKRLNSIFSPLPRNHNRWWPEPPEKPPFQTDNTRLSPGAGVVRRAEEGIAVHPFVPGGSDYLICRFLTGLAMKPNVFGERIIEVLPDNETQLKSPEKN
jgi:hypothetical protein